MATDDPADFPVPDTISDNTQPVGEFQTNEAVLAKLVQDSPIAMVVSTLGDGRMLAVNDSFVRLVGYPRYEVIGQTAIGLGLWADPAPRAERTEALMAGAPLGDVEATVHTKSGAERQVQAAVSEVTIEGRSCLLTQLSDVTAQRPAEHFLDDLPAFVSREVRPPR
jgi:PAS domain S-box-containing protein